MSDDHDAQSLHYLPVEVSGQVFALPMSEVAAIHQLGGEDASISGTGGSEQSTIPIVDLRSLFFPASQHNTGHPTYVVVISTPMFTYAVLVDTVRPARRAGVADQLAIPPIISGSRYPFSGVIREASSLVLIVHSRLLAEELRRVKPGLVVEQPHGS